MISLQCSYTQNQLQKLFQKAILGKRIHCGYCGSYKIKRTKDNRFFCSECRKKFSLKSISIFKGSKLSLKTLYCLLECWLKELPVKQTVQLLNLSRQTVSKYYRKFRIMSPKINKMFSGKIKIIDDSYFGGRRKGKRGRGAAGKTMIFGIYDSSLKQAKTFEIKNNLNCPYFKIVATYINHHTDKSGLFISDDFESYRIASQWLKLNHNSINHSVRFKETNPIENVWSVLKTKLKRIYHHATPKYMAEYVKELTYRFNSRFNPDNPFTFLEKSLQLQPITASIC